MKRGFGLGLALALMLLTLGGVASAQGPQRCFGDVVNFRACFDENDNLELLHIDSRGVGIRVGEVPQALFRYAAATYEAEQFVHRFVSPDDGSYVDLYFHGKRPAPANQYDTFWTAVLYNADGVRLTAQEFQYRAIASAEVVPELAAAPVPAGSGGAGTTVAPAAPSAAGEYEPVIVTPGTVQECLVRATYTVRMRAAPTTQAAILDNVPYDTSMPADMRTVDGEWVRAFYVGEGGVGKLGWINARYLEQSEACEAVNQTAPYGGMAAAPPPPATTTTTQAAEPGGEAAVEPEVSYDYDLTVVVPGSVAQCLVRTTYTVRMRAAPTTAAPMLDNVPYNTSMPADLRTADDNWIRANYLGTLGWVNARYLDLSEACAGLNAIAAIP